MKVWFIVLLSILLCGLIYAESSSSSINWASKRYVDTNFCMLDGDCNISNLNVVNETVTNIDILGDINNSPYNIKTNNLWATEIISNSLKVDEIDEYTTDNGVNIELFNFKDSVLTALATTYVAGTWIWLGGISTQALSPSSDGVFDLGTRAKRYNALYLSENMVVDTLNLSSGYISDDTNNIHFGINNLSTEGNITAEYFYGDGSQLMNMNSWNETDVNFLDVNASGTGTFEEGIIVSSDPTYGVYPQAGFFSDDTTHQAVIRGVYPPNFAINFLSPTTYYSGTISAANKRFEMTFGGSGGYLRGYDSGGAQGFLLRGYAYNGMQGYFTKGTVAMYLDDYGHAYGANREMNIFYGSDGYGYINLTDSEEEELKILGSLNVLGNLNQTGGNFTGNQIYGEMWNYSSHSTPWTFDITSDNVYFNFTGLTSGNNNGFDFTDETQVNGGSYLTAKVSGKYKMDFSMSFSSNNVGGTFGIGIVRDFDVSTHRNCYARREASTDIGNVGVTCFMDLPAGCKVNIQIENEDNTRDVVVHTVNLNLVRVGD